MVTGRLTEDHLLDTMLAGDRMHKTAGVILAAGIAVEYDKATYHSAESDVKRDVAKTAKLLSAYPDLLVLRLRVGGCPSLPAEHPAIADPRCVIVETTSRSVARVVEAAAAAPAPHLRSTPRHSSATRSRSSPMAIAETAGWTTSFTPCSSGSTTPMSPSRRKRRRSWTAMRAPLGGFWLRTA